MPEHRSAYLPATYDGAPGGRAVVPSVYGGSRAKVLPFLFTGDAAQNDTIVLCPVPSWGVAVPWLTKFRCSAFGTNVTMDVGFKADAAIGFAGAVDALVNGVDVASAITTETSMMSAVAVGDLFKRWWELAGLTSDPRCDLWIVATLLSANPDSATLVGSVGVLRD